MRSAVDMVLTRLLDLTSRTHWYDLHNSLTLRAETGVTVLFTVLKMDAGPILSQRKMTLAGDEQVRAFGEGFGSVREWEGPESQPPRCVACAQGNHSLSRSAAGAGLARGLAQSKSGGCPESPNAKVCSLRRFDARQATPFRFMHRPWP